VDAHHAVLKAQVHVVLLDDRAWREPHQAHCVERSLERVEDLAKVRTGRKHRRVREIRTRRIRVDHHHRMRGTSLAPQWDDAPVAVVVLSDEMLGPTYRAQPVQVAGQQVGIEGERQSQSIGQLHR
jgi:hypothetical protein